MTGPRYNTTCLRNETAQGLADVMQEFWENNPNVSIRNITLLQEIDRSRLDPTKGKLFWSAIVTYRVPVVIDAN